MSKKIISILLAIVLCCSLLSLVFAEGESVTDPSDTSTTAGDVQDPSATEPSSDSSSEPSSEP